MKRLLLALVLTIGTLIAAFTYERLFIEKTMGPAAVVALLALAVLFCMLLGTLLLYESRHRNVVGNIWLAMVSIGLTYIIVDLAAGYLLIKPLSPPLVPDEYRHHKLIPNSYAQFTQRDFSYVQRVNNLGMRGQDQPVVKPANTIRIVTLGDSFTMGKGVEDDQTFSVGIERILNERLAACGSHWKVQVLNGGVDSYAPILSYMQFKRDIAPLKPDLVVHSLDVSDLLQEAAYRKIAEYSADGELIGIPQREGQRASLTEQVRRWIEKHMFLTRLALYYLNEAFGFKELSVREAVTEAHMELLAYTLQGDTVDRDGQWADMFASILMLRDLVQRIDANYMLTTYPWGHQVNDREWIPGRYSFMPEGSVASDAVFQRVAEFAESNSLWHLDLQPTFRAYSGGAPLYFKSDMHMTAAGQALMADGIARSLAERYLPKWCTAGNN